MASSTVLLEHLLEGLSGNDDSEVQGLNSPPAIDDLGKSVAACSNFGNARTRARIQILIDEANSIPPELLTRGQGKRYGSPYSVPLGSNAARHRLSRPRMGRAGPRRPGVFEFLTLEGAQAGLSWETILNKRDAYREAFAGFDPARVARFTRRDGAPASEPGHRPQPPEGRQHGANARLPRGPA